MQCRVPGFPAQRRPLAPGAAATEAPPALAPAPLQQLNGSASLVRFGFPKGSLQKATEELFARAGYQVRLGGLRTRWFRESNSLSLPCSHLPCFWSVCHEQVRISERGYFPKARGGGESLRLSDSAKWE